METLKVRTPKWILTIGGRDVTGPLEPWIIDITYTDQAHGKSDEVDVAIVDRDGRWRDDWYPQQGDELNLQIGYDGEGLVPCGDFEIEELDFSGPPDVVHIRAVASGIKEALRTKCSKAYEDQSLRDIAQDVATKNGLSLCGQIDDIEFKRITQNQEPDLTFLKRLAGNYGHVFSVKGRKLVCCKYSDLRAADAVATIHRATDVARWSIRDKSIKTYKDCEVSYDCPKSKRNLSHQCNGDGSTVDRLKIVRRCENEQQAKLQADAALEAANDAKLDGSLTLEGDPYLVAGTNINLSGFGKLDGKYFIQTSRHRLSRDAGYTTDLEIKRGADDAAPNE